MLMNTSDKFLKFSHRQAKALLPKRQKTDHKAIAGKSLLIAGSRGMFGAAVLAATAAARVGSGYVILMTDSDNFSSVRHPDFLLMNWKKSKISELSTLSVGIGPGLGKSKIALKLLKQLIISKIQNVVVDADALNLVAENGLWPLPTTWIATPHEGELARLLGASSAKIRQDRRGAILSAQRQLGCLVLLKGYRTLIASPVGNYEIQSGNPALAKAGTGDVLTGMITGFLAQGLSVKDSACLGAFVHGWVADEWVREKKDPLSFMASDLLHALPESLARIRRS